MAVSRPLTGCVHFFKYHMMFSDLEAFFSVNIMSVSSNFPHVCCETGAVTLQITLQNVYVTGCLYKAFSCVTCGSFMKNRRGNVRNVDLVAC